MKNNPHSKFKLILIIFIIYIIAVVISEQFYREYLFKKSIKIETDIYKIQSTSMSTTSLIFAFNIITNETYSTINQCELTIKINSCYIGCYLCYNIETDTSHNCESCKRDYYKSPENENDCYKISEKKDNWFYDTNTNSLKLCYDKCKSCSDFYDESTDNMNCNECIDN